jgi:hypothetical protein
MWTKNEIFSLLQLLTMIVLGALNISLQSNNPLKFISSLHTNIVQVALRHFHALQRRGDEVSMS